MNKQYIKPQNSLNFDGCQNSKRILKSKILIFDFDGTIVNSKAVYYKAMNKHLEDYGFSKKEVDKAIDIGLNVGETIKKFFPSPLRVWWLRKKIIGDVIRDVQKVKKCRDADSIRKLKTRKILISNSYSDFVMPILEHLKLRDEFDDVFTAENFDDKAEFIKSYLKENKMNKKEVFYVGDRVADVKLAREVGIKSIIVAGKCAWDSRKEILAEKPDFVVSDIDDIKKII